MRVLSNFVSLSLSLSFLALSSVTVQAASWPACTQPAIRKEWRALTADEKGNWISAVKCLANLPRAANFTPGSKAGGNGVPPYNASGSYYDDFVYMHIDLSPKIHSTGLFFTWHRWYVQVYENVLREKCGLTTPSPYWDWAKDSANVQTSTMFTDTDPVSGLGGWGDTANDLEITTGGFAKGFALSYPSYHHLRRQYTRTMAGFTGGQIDLPGTFTPAKISALLTNYNGNFTGFQVNVEKQDGPHAGGHFVVGGDLAGGCPRNAPRGCNGGPYWSANEPVFWLHHGMVDKLWYDWQMKDTRNANAFEGGSVQDFSRPTGGPPMLSMSSVMPADGLGPEVTIGDIMNTTGGFLCYKYV